MVMSQWINLTSVLKSRRRDLIIHFLFAYLANSGIDEYFRRELFVYEIRDK